MASESARAFLEPYVHILRLGIAFNLLKAFFASDARVLDPAERGPRYVFGTPVDPQVAGLYVTSRGQRGVQVSRPDAGGQAQRKRVGMPDRLVVVIERRGDQDRSEDLVSEERTGRARGGGEERRGDEEAGPAELIAAGNQLQRRVAEAGIDEAADPVVLGQRDDRPHVGGLKSGVADGQRPHALGKTVDEALVDAALDEEPRR